MIDAAIFFVSTPVLLGFTSFLVASDGVVVADDGVVAIVVVSAGKTLNASTVLVKRILVEYRISRNSAGDVIQSCVECRHTDGV